MAKNTQVAFVRVVCVENTDGMTNEEIREKAVDLYNNPPGGMDDMYVSEDAIISMDEVEGDDDEGDEE